jgi:F420-non-reducing hydrogenase iron-sulfur subunit
MANNTDFEPTLIGFLCRWCSYQGADLAGTSRLKYPPNLVPIRVNCSGRLDPVFILHALRSGADGVLVAGCHPGDCHYQDGNYKALRRIVMMKKALETFGIDPRRVKLQWISASEGELFAQTVRSFVEEIKALGPMEREGKPAAAQAPAEAKEAAPHAEEARVLKGEG